MSEEQHVFCIDCGEEIPAQDWERVFILDQCTFCGSEGNIVRELGTWAVGEGDKGGA